MSKRALVVKMLKFVDSVYVAFWWLNRKETPDCNSGKIHAYLNISALFRRRLRHQDHAERCSQKSMVVNWSSWCTQELQLTRLKVACMQLSGRTFLPLEVAIVVANQRLHDATLRNRHWDLFKSVCLNQIQFLQEPIRADSNRTAPRLTREQSVEFRENFELFLMKFLVFIHPMCPRWTNFVNSRHFY